MFTKKAMLLTSQAVHDALGMHTDMVTNSVNSFFAENPNASEEEIEHFKGELLEEFKKKVNASALDIVEKQYSPIRAKFKEAYDMNYSSFHQEDNLELTAGEMYYLMFGAIKNVGAPTTRAGMLDYEQNHIIEKAFSPFIEGE